MAQSARCGWVAWLEILACFNKRRGRPDAFFYRVGLEEEVTLYMWACEYGCSSRGYDREVVRRLLCQRYPLRVVSVHVSSHIV